MSVDPRVSKQALLAGPERWADAHVIPWDTEIFGFGSAALEVQQTHAAPEWRAQAAASVRDWAGRQRAVVIAATVPAGALAQLDAMADLGFVCVDLALQVSLAITKRRPRLLRAAAVRDAAADEHARIEQIAANAFDFGRYHRDARFPRELANRRFARLTRQALARADAGTRCYVMGPAGNPLGFLLVEIAAGRCVLKLGGVDASTNPGLAGPMLFAGVIDALEQQGVHSVSAKISAANTAVLNLYAALGFHTSAPEYTFHWHQRSSPHLVTP